MTYLEAKRIVEEKNPWGITAGCTFYKNKYVFAMIDKDDVYDKRLGYTSLSEFIVDPETGEIKPFFYVWDLPKEEHDDYLKSEQKHFIPIDPKTGMYAEISK